MTKHSRLMSRALGRLPRSGMSGSDTRFHSAPPEVDVGAAVTIKLASIGGVDVQGKALCMSQGRVLCRLPFHPLPRAKLPLVPVGASKLRVAPRRGFRRLIFASRLLVPPSKCFSRRIVPAYLSWRPCMHTAPQRSQGWANCGILGPIPVSCHVGRSGLCAAA